MSRPAATSTSTTTTATTTAAAAVADDAATAPPPPVPAAAAPPPPEVHASPTHHKPTGILSYFPTASLNDPTINAVAGATAGFVSGVFVCPLDVIKTKLQAQGGWQRSQPWRAKGETHSSIPGHPMRYRGFRGTFGMIVREEGVRGLYRGLGPLILGYLPTWMVYFTVYGRAKVAMEDVIHNKPLNHISCALFAGASSTLCTNPIWVIKTRLMSQNSSRSTSLDSPYHYRSTLDAAKKMYLHEGVRSFYSGLGPALLGLTHVAVQFPLYEFFKSTFTGGAGLGQSSSASSQPSNFVAILAASVLSKMAASSATYPHEVLRTRMQTQRILVGHAHEDVGVKESGVQAYRGVLRSAGMIWREEGWRAFYAGMGTNMIRAVPASAVTMLTFEAIMSQLLKIRDRAREADPAWNPIH